MTLKHPYAKTWRALGIYFEASSGGRPGAGRDIAPSRSRKVVTSGQGPQRATLTIDRFGAKIGLGTMWGELKPS